MKDTTLDVYKGPYSVTKGPKQNSCLTHHSTRECSHTMSDFIQTYTNCLYHSNWTPASKQSAINSSSVSVQLTI